MEGEKGGISWKPGQGGVYFYFSLLNSPSPGKRVAVMGSELNALKDWVFANTERSFLNRRLIQDRLMAILCEF